MLLPGFVLMCIFLYIPMFGLRISFTEYSIVNPNSAGEWVGLEHFKEFLYTPDFWNAMKNTLGISVYKIMVGFPIPILFALLLNEIKQVRLKKTIQTISYLPHFLSWIIVGGILGNWMSDTGLINEIFVRWGILKEPVFFMGKPKYFWHIAVFSDVWKEMGYAAIIYIAAMAGIDPQLYEAATVDGAGRFARMRHITLPGITGTIVVLFIINVGYMLNINFDQIMALTNAANREASEVIDVFIYRMGIRTSRFSYATAMGLFRSIISLILLLLAQIFSKKMTGRGIY